MIKHLLALLALFFISTSGLAQPNKKSVVIGEMVTRSNAVLILNPPGGDQGVLLPQVTTTNRLLIVPTSPDEDGLVVFDINEKFFYYWKNGQWVKGLGDGADLALTYSAGTNAMSLNGTSVDLSSLKEIPNQLGHVGKYLTSDGTTLSWATLSNVGDMTAIFAGAGLTGGAATGDATLGIGTDNTTISINGANKLQLSDLAVTQNKISAGAVTSTKLSPTGVTGGTYGNASQVAQITVDAQGRITNASSVLIGATAPTGAAGGDLSGIYPNPLVATNTITSAKILDGTVSSADIADGTIVTTDLGNNSVTSTNITNGAVISSKLANTTVSPGTYGTATAVPQFVVDAQGRITSATNTSISGIPASGPAGGDLTGSYPNPTVSSNAIASAEILDNTIASADIADGTISNADINSTAAIAVNKLATGTDGQVLSVVALVPTWTTIPGLTAQPAFYVVDPSDFQMLKSDGKADKHGMAIFESDNTFVTAARDNEGENIMSSLHLPHGATLTEMIIYYWDNAPENLVVSLMRKNLATGVNQVIATWTSSLASATIRSQTIITFGGMEVIANDTFSYRILINFDINGNVDNPGQAKQRMYAVRVQYLY